MNRYYLHLRDFNGAIFEDLDGSELPGLADAVEEAVRGLSELLAEAIKQGAEPEYEAIAITDEGGAHLAAVPLLAALPKTIVGLLKQPHKVVPQDRYEEYRRNADECRRKAGNATGPSDKVSWLKLADDWLQMLPTTGSHSGEGAGWPKGSDEDSTASH